MSKFNFFHSTKKQFLDIFKVLEILVLWMTHRLIQLILGVGRFEVGAKIQLGLKNVRECGGPAIDVSGVVDVVNVDAVPKAVDLPIKSVCAIEKSIEIISRFQTPSFFKARSPFGFNPIFLLSGNRAAALKTYPNYQSIKEDFSK